MEVEEIPPELRTDREAQAYVLIKDRVFAHTKDFDSELLESTGMDIDFANIWRAIGWDTLIPITEEGSRSLTIQFLCTLQYNDDGVSFHLFGKEYKCTWKDLSLFLGFRKKCLIDFERVVRDFDHHSIWTSISGQVVVGNFKPRCNDIHHLTLRFMHM